MKSKKFSAWDEVAACPAIGADVCKKHLDVAGLCGTACYSRRTDNSAQEIGACIKALVENGFKGTVLCEATSHYHLASAVMLCEAGLDVRAINPLMSSKHAKSAIRKIKTDRVDAQALATMLLTEPNLPPPLRLSRSHCLVRHALGLIHSQEQHLQGMRRALDSCKERLLARSWQNNQTRPGLAEKKAVPSGLGRSHELPSRAALL